MENCLEDDNTSSEKEAEEDGSSTDIYGSSDTSNSDVDINESDDSKRLGTVAVNKKKTGFPCLICAKKFTQNSGRYNHMKRIHNVHPVEKSKIKCLEAGCLFSCAFKEKLQLHLAEEHGINMEVSVKQFDNLPDFLRWKDDFERQEKCRFVKKSGSRMREHGIRVAYYYCNRSGNYVSQSRGMKTPKKIGTAKSNNHCTASITCFELPNGKFDVKICSTHYGHESELHHLRLTQTEKFQIAEQLSRGVSHEMVIDNIRASAGSDIERIHLITVKDVKNIGRAYGIQSSRNGKTNNMYFNLTDWVSKIILTDNSPVLYFNEEGSFRSKDHDITLILLTKGQLEVLNRYSEHGLFYVNTFIANSKSVPFYNLYVRSTAMNVTTLMLLDDLNEAVPVSFILTHNLNSSKLKIFFDSLKKRVPKISANAVFTDDNKEVYDVWCSVFQQQPLHLWSNHYVDRDWRDNLDSISNEQLQDSIYEKLYLFLESTDVSRLKTELITYIKELQSNVVTSKFGNYFFSKYIGTEEMWAACFGKQSVGVQAQLNLENMCNKIEEITIKKHWDRNFLVRIVQHLLKSVSEKHCVRQNKLQSQIREIPTHHSLALSIKQESIHQESDNCWRVNSAKDPDNVFSLVSHQNSISKYCKETVCALKCSKCNECVHNFKCSCNVYMYDKTMCKHIHAVAMKLFITSEVTTYIKEESPTTNDKEEDELDRHKRTLYSEWHLCKRGRKKKVRDPIEKESIPDSIKNVKRVNADGKEHTTTKSHQDKMGKKRKVMGPIMEEKCVDVTKDVLHNTENESQTLRRSKRLLDKNEIIIKKVLEVPASKTKRKSINSSEQDTATCEELHIV